MKKLVLWVWQFPQNIVGLIVKVIFKTEYLFTILHHVKVYHIDCRCIREGLSLGHYIFVTNYETNNFILIHHRGHCKQSEIFGPFYFLIIGIPSLLLRIGLCGSHYLRDNYYSMYPEKWANKLGGLYEDRQNK